MATEGYIDPDWPNPHGPDDARFIIYGYTPSFALCVFAIVLLTIATALHLFQSVKYRNWYFIPLIVACGMEVLGYSFRTLSARRDPYRVQYFVLQYFFIVTAPVLITASIYVCLNKLISWSSSKGFSPDSTWWLNPKGILWGFITCDLVSTVMQVAGAALIGEAESDRKDPTTPNNILLAGLAFQSAAFLTFLTILGLYVAALVRHVDFGPRLRGKRRFVLALGVASATIYVRIIFRLAETAQGVFGYLMVHEAFFGILEFAPVAATVLILAAWHPGRWLPRQSPREGVRKV